MQESQHLDPLLLTAQGGHEGMQSSVQRQGRVVVLLASTG